MNEEMAQQQPPSTPQQQEVGGFGGDESAVISPASYNSEEEAATQATFDTQWTSSPPPPPPPPQQQQQQSDLENATTMTSNNYGDDDDDVEQQIHDQLPSVEEYKTHMIPGQTSSPNKIETAAGGSGGGASTVAAESTAAVGGDDVVALGGGDDDDDDYIHDQLPTVEEYKASTGTVVQPANTRSISSSTRRCSVCHVLCCIIFLGLVVAAVLIPISIQKGSDGTISFGGLLSRRKRVVTYLADANISTEVSLNFPGTPQYEAAKWIADNDSMKMHIPEIVYAGSRNHNKFIERYVMALLYFATSGGRWRYDANFLSSNDICDWNGLTTAPFSGESIFLGITCEEFVASISEEEKVSSSDKVSYAREIYLFENRMAGMIPDEIQHLQYVRTISMYNNPGIDGPFPRGLIEMENLSYLALQYCAITGTVPHDIGRLTAMTNLGLSNNLLTQELPDSLFDLTDLEWLFLDDNLLTGDVAKFGKLTNLKGLYAEDMSLFGQISNDMIDGWSSLKELDLSTNLIAGGIPNNILNHPLLEILDLHQNQFTGTLPVVQRTNTQLKFLSIYDNNLNGIIPATIGNIENLIHLDLAMNGFELPLPGTIGQLTNLRYLFTNSNNFGNHKVPNFVPKLTNLRELSMKDNNLTGAIPTTIASLGKLVLLDLDRNNLTGKIPSEISHLSNLAFLFLNRNNLTGTLPSSMTTMYTLAAILLDGNSLNGTADVICKDEFFDLQFFSSDCLGPNVELSCDCCSLCCNDNSNGTCNNFEWTLNLDPIWEYAHSRAFFTVDLSELDDEQP